MTAAFAVDRGSPFFGRVLAVSRLAVVTLAAAVVFAVAGILSGLLIDEHGGVVGALEWVLRTLVVVAAVVAIVGGALLVLRLRRRVRPRPVGWAVAIAALIAFVWFVAVPVGYGVYLTHLPARRAVQDVDLGARKVPVTLTGEDRIRLRGWYVPSRNGAAILALHGTGSSRNGVADHARLLARHGYGVLALDLRGHGQSDGRSTSLPWTMDDDLDSALAWLARRPDVEPGRIGALGVSMGGEVAVQAAARLRELRAIVAEGLRGGPSDASAGGSDPATVASLWGLFFVGNVLGGSWPPGSDAELVERIAPRRLLLISAGRGVEADANRVFAQRAGRAAEHWNLPAAAHAAALHTDPEGYERRVIPFLNRALLGRPA